jgi:hypothetical protein
VAAKVSDMGMLPMASDIHEKNGTTNNSFLAIATCLIGQVDAIQNPSILLA